MLPNTAEKTLPDCTDLIASLFARCVETAPNFGVGEQQFQEHLQRAARKYLFTNADDLPTPPEVEQFLNQLQIHDVFLAVACANGSERAWWEFDQHHRGYLERVARHLASSDVNAEEVVDTVYVELYGTRIVEGVRQSKFATYSGRGSLRGWLRTIVWHALVDLHRAGHDEISLDEMTETVGEGHTQSTFLHQPTTGEKQMLDDIVRQRYQNVTFKALEAAFVALDDHEKLLLLFYHVENLKLRDIARMVETPDSTLRNWFQRRTAQRETTPNSRVHESTVMRWLEKTRDKVLRLFKTELTRNHALKDSEIELCIEIAAQDLVHGNLTNSLTASKKTAEIF